MLITTIFKQQMYSLAYWPVRSSCPMALCNSLLWSVICSSLRDTNMILLSLKLHQSHFDMWIIWYSRSLILIYNLYTCWVLGKKQKNKKRYPKSSIKFCWCSWLIYRHYAWHTYPCKETKRKASCAYIADRTTTSWVSQRNYLITDVSKSLANIHYNIIRLIDVGMIKFSTDSHSTCMKLEKCKS